MAAAARRPRVLVVEDDDTAALYLRRLLERAGWEVVGPAGRLGEALRLATEAVDLDAALLDLNLGAETSAPVAEVLADRGVPFVFLTGDSGMLPEPLRARPTLRKSSGSGAAVLAALAAAAGLP